MTAEKNEKKHFIQFFRDSGDKAFLPSVSFEGQKLSEREYPVKCIDDKIHVEYAKGKKMSLDEWFDKYSKK
jgi:hypothetical protein